MQRDGIELKEVLRIVRERLTTVQVDALPKMVTDEAPIPMGQLGMMSLSRVGDGAAFWLDKPALESTRNEAQRALLLDELRNNGDVRTRQHDGRLYLEIEVRHDVLGHAVIAAAVQ